MALCVPLKLHLAAELQPFLLGLLLLELCTKLPPEVLELCCSSGAEGKPRKTKRSQTLLNSSPASQRNNNPFPSLPPCPSCRNMNPNPSRIWRLPGTGRISPAGNCSVGVRFAGPVSKFLPVQNSGRTAKHPQELEEGGWERSRCGQISAVGQGIAWPWELGMQQGHPRVPSLSSGQLLSLARAAKWKK